MSCLTENGRFSRVFPVAGLIMSALLVAGPVVGQQRTTPVRLLDVSSDVQTTPRYEAEVSDSADLARGRGEEWFIVRARYETSRDWLDELTVAVYVLVRDESGDSGDGGERGSRLVLAGQTTYVDVPQGEHKAVMALQPSTFQRYGEPEAIAVVIRTEGRVAASESKPRSRSDWWDQLPSRGGVVINRLASPWAMLFFDDFEAIKGSTESP